MRKAALSTSEPPLANVVPLQASLQEPSPQANHTTDVDQPAPVLTNEVSAYTTGEYVRLSWQRSSIRKVQYNKQLQEWIEYDPNFNNWLRSCVMLHADSGAFETKCTIPDQWREDVGVEVTIVSANAIPVRQGEPHKVVEGVYHVMC